VIGIVGSILCNLHVGNWIINVSCVALTWHPRPSVAEYQLISAQAIEEGNPIGKLFITLK
jgi:hypothetical protein